MLLKVMGLKFVKQNQQWALTEKDEIMLWRRQYLQQIKKFHNEGKSMCANSGHTITKIWTDQTVKSSKQAFLEGLSTGLKNPSGKRKRLIVLHEWKKVLWRWAHCYLSLNP
jgi:hypothetical protein